MRTCGECKWWSRIEHGFTGVCCAPLPESLLDQNTDDPLDGDPQAMRCDCFRGREEMVNADMEPEVSATWSAEIRLTKEEP